MAGLAKNWYQNNYTPDQMQNILLDKNYTENQLSSFAGGLGTDMAGLKSYAVSDPGLWDQTKDLIGNKDFMSGLQGVGTLGLGLANYLSMQPVYEEQLKGLKQNRQFAAENQQNRKNIASDLG